MLFSQPCRGIYYLYWGVVVVLVSYIAPIDKNAVLELLINKRNELAKMINKDEIMTEDDDLASEEEIIESCLVPLIDGLFNKIASMPIIEMSTKEIGKFS